MAHAKAGKRSYTDISAAAGASDADERGLRLFSAEDLSPAPSQPLVIVGLDQGTAYTGYAVCPFIASPKEGFSFDHLKRVKDGIRTGELSGPTSSGTFGDRAKGPSVVALELTTSWQRRQHRNPRAVREHKFGTEAQDIAASFAATRLADPTALPTYDVFTDFKRPLHPHARGKTPILDVVRPSVTSGSRQLRCVDAVSLINGACLTRALRQYNEAKPDRPATPRDMRVVATYPNEWDDVAVSAVRRAILVAPVEYRERGETKLGQVLPGNLIQVPESVAAFISLALQAALEYTPDVAAATSADDAVRLSELLHEGMVILCCDAGAGTVDITVNVVQNLAPFRIKEVVYSRGRDLGGSMVEDAFMRFFKSQLQQLGVKEAHWTANPLVEYTLRTHILTMKAQYDPRDDTDDAPLVLDVNAVGALFPPARAATWWSDVKRVFQALGAVDRRGVIITIGMPEASDPIRYVQRDVTGAFSAHSYQAHAICIPRRFMHELLTYNAECIVDFTLDVVRKINATPLAAVNDAAGSATAASASSSAAPAGNFKVDAIFLAGQGTVSPVHRDLLRKRLERVELAPGQLRRQFVYPTGFSMHVSRGAVMYSMLGATQVRRRLACSYGVRLRLDGETPWVEAGLTKEAAETEGVLYREDGLHESLHSLDYIAPFAQRGDEVLPNAPYALERGSTDTLKLVPCADGSPQEFTFEVYALPSRLNAFGSKLPLHVVSRTNTTGERIVPASSMLARILVTVHEPIDGRLRFSFASGTDDVISCAIEGTTGKDVTTMRVVPATVTYSNRSPAAARRTAPTVAPRSASSAARARDEDLDGAVIEVDDDDDDEVLVPSPPAARARSSGYGAPARSASYGMSASSSAASWSSAAAAAAAAASYRGSSAAGAPAPAPDAQRKARKDQPRPWGAQSREGAE